jgi:hypothetical protein
MIDTTADMANPANDNYGWLRNRSTALDHLYALQRELQTKDTTDYSFHRKARHQDALRKLERAIRTILDEC